MSRSCNSCSRLTVRGSTGVPNGQKRKPRPMVALGIPGGIQAPLLPALTFLNPPHGLLSFCLSRCWGEVGDLGIKPGRGSILLESWNTT